MNPYFNDRSEAGKVLAQVLSAYKDRPDTIVLTLPRGGVPVALEIVKMLNLPMDLMIVRKLGVPGHEEYAMGAIARQPDSYISNPAQLNWKWLTNHSVGV